MKFSMSKEWVLSKAKDEKGFDVAAGHLDHDRASDIKRLSVVSAEQGTAEHCAFSSLVQMLRRARALSIEALAEKSRVDVAELVSIECDVRYEPRPRTVHQLAKFFSLPEKRLLDLSNLTTTRSHELTEAAVRFAANAKKMLDLSPEERQALIEFVKFLGSK
jgi:transcriptional regulator with XRE-family HTH domain